MSERISLLDRPSVPEVPDADRIPVPRSIAVVDGLPGTPIVAALAGAIGSRVVRARIALRTRIGHDVAAVDGSGVVVVATHPGALTSATRALLDALPPHDVVVLEGAPLLAATSPRLAILGAPSSSLITLDPDVRALKGRFDLVVHDFRPKTMELLAAALAF